MDAIFNELSVEPLAPDRHAVHGRIVALHRCIQSAVKRGMHNALRTHREFVTVPLAQDGHTFIDWQRERMKSLSDKDTARAMLSRLTRAPYIEDIKSRAEVDRDTLIECRIEHREGFGVAVSVLHDLPVVSLSHGPWCTTELRVEALYVAADSPIAVSVKNLHDEQSVERHTPWLHERLRQELARGDELLKRQIELVPQLEFTPGAREQISALTTSDRVFQHVLRHLFALNERARTWKLGEHFSTGYPLPCSDESDQTLKKFPDSRRFTDEAGRRQLFSWHSKVGADAWRVHFIADDSTRRVCVGYVGPHLPTVNDPH